MLLMEEDAEVGSMLVHEGEQLFIITAQFGGMFAGQLETVMQT